MLNNAMEGIEEDDDAPQIIVCMLGKPTMFKDDVMATCMFCKREIHHRPNVPTPNRVCCIECFDERREPHDTILVTRTSIMELLSKMRH